MGYQQFDKLRHKLSRIEGKMLGPLHDVYRVDDDEWLNWKVASNKTMQLNASFKIGNSYNSNQQFALPKGNVAMDGRNVQSGDIFIDEANGNTFFVGERMPNRPWQGILANKLITISQLSSTDYGDSGDGWGAKHSSDQDVARNIPACVLEPGARSIDQGFIPAGTTNAASINNYEIYFWLPEGMVTNGAIITFDNKKIQAQQVFRSPAGYKVTGVKAR